VGLSNPRVKNCICFWMTFWGVLQTSWLVSQVLNLFEQAFKGQNHSIASNMTLTSDPLHHSTLILPSQLCRNLLYLKKCYLSVLRNSLQHDNNQKCAIQKLWRLMISVLICNISDELNSSL
jgi:hypothetical protein